MEWLFFGSIIVFHIVGVFLHELGHKIFCDIFKVKVFEVKYFNWHSDEDGVEGWVVHEKPKHLHQSLFITLGPMFTNGIVLLLFISVVNFFQINILFSIFYGVIIGLLTSLFPSKPDIVNVLQHLGHSNLNKLYKLGGKFFCYFLMIFTSEFVRLILAVILALSLLSIAPNVVDDMDGEYKVHKDCLNECISTYGNNEGFYQDYPSRKISVDIVETEYDHYTCTCYNSDKSDGFVLEYTYE
jgi:hypothetical protein